MKSTKNILGIKGLSPGSAGANRPRLRREPYRDRYEEEYYQKTDRREYRVLPQPEEAEQGAQKFQKPSELAHLLLRSDPL